jgi:hypothetical protein
MKGDQGESICAESSRVLKTQIEIQLGLFPFAIVPLLAGNLTCATADALGYVDQRGLDRGLGCQLRHDLLRPSFDTSAEGPYALTTLTRQAFVS